MKVQRLLEMLREERYDSCRDEAERLLHDGALQPEEKAVLFHALSRSLCGLNLCQEALGPGELAVHYARETAQWDLLGRAICNSGYVYGLNRLYGKAVDRMGEFFIYKDTYEKASALEGWVYYNLAVFYREWGRMDAALEQYEKAYEWYLSFKEDPVRTEKCRSNLIWHCLRMGLWERVEPLLSESEQFLRGRPHDADAHTRHLNNVAYYAYLKGDLGSAVSTGLRVLREAEDLPTRRAYACLILHYAAKALGLHKEAVGMGILARMQSYAARRPDLDEEINRSLMQIHQGQGLPLMDELFRDLGQHARKAGRRLGPAS